MCRRERALVCGLNFEMSVLGASRLLIQINIMNTVRGRQAKSIFYCCVSLPLLALDGPWALTPRIQNTPHHTHIRRDVYNCWFIRSIKTGQKWRRRTRRREACAVRTEIENVCWSRGVCVWRFRQEYVSLHGPWYFEENYCISEKHPWMFDRRVNICSSFFNRLHGIILSYK